MDLLLSPEQQEIVSSVTDYLSRELPLDRVRSDAGLAVAAWPRLAELGVFGLGLAEEDGGVGLGVAEETLVFREFGRALTPGPLLGGVLGAHVAAAAGARDLLDGIVSGTVRVALAEPYRDPAAVVDEKSSGVFRVLDARDASLCLLMTPGSAALVETSALRVRPTTAVDHTVGLGLADLTDVPATALVRDPAIWWRGCVLVAAVHTGIAEAARDASVTHVSVREQFGKPIGAFQAVKHRCADMAVRAEAAYFQTIYAALSWGDGAPTGRLQVSSARVVAADAARANAADNIVNHGAMGFTQEANPHLLSRRALVYETVLSTPRWHLEAVAAEREAGW